MKVVIAKWKDTNKYVLVAKSNNEILIRQKQQQTNHLHSKIVTVDVPIPANKTPTQQNTTQTPINKGSSDGVNSKEIALHGIDR